MLVLGVALNCPCGFHLHLGSQLLYEKCDYLKPTTLRRLKDETPWRERKRKVREGGRETT